MNEEQPKERITRWFTFGQAHRHVVNDVVFDKNVVVEITAYDPRNVMFAFFGPKWSMEYYEQPNLTHFPKGVHKLNGGAI